LPEAFSGLKKNQKSRKMDFFKIWSGLSVSKAKINITWPFSCSLACTLLLDMTGCSTPPGGRKVVLWGGLAGPVDLLAGPAVCLAVFPCVSGFA